MGMFDKLYINPDMLPISDEEKKFFTKETEWQTKSLDNVLTEVYITDDRQLQVNEWTLESVPKEERPYPNDDGIKGMMGSLRRVNEHLVTIPHHGFIVFYSKANDKWYEFKAKFTDGKLIGIIKLEE